MSTRHHSGDLTSMESLLQHAGEDGGKHLDQTFAARYDGSSDIMHGKYQHDAIIDAILGPIEQRVSDGPGILEKYRNSHIFPWVLHGLRKTMSPASVATAIQDNPYVEDWSPTAKVFALEAMVLRPDIYAAGKDADVIKSAIHRLIPQESGAKEPREVAKALHHIAEFGFTLDPQSDHVDGLKFLAKSTSMVAPLALTALSFLPVKDRSEVNNSKLPFFWTQAVPGYEGDTSMHRSGDDIHFRDMIAASFFHGIGNGSSQAKIDIIREDPHCVCFFPHEKIQDIEVVKECISMVAQGRCGLASSWNKKNGNTQSPLGMLLNMFDHLPADQVDPGLFEQSVRQLVTESPFTTIPHRALYLLYEHQKNTQEKKTESPLYARQELRDRAVLLLMSDALPFTLKENMAQLHETIGYAVACLMSDTTAPVDRAEKMSQLTQSRTVSDWFDLNIRHGETIEDIMHAPLMKRLPVEDPLRDLMRRPPVDATQALRKAIESLAIPKDKRDKIVGHLVGQLADLLKEEAS